jgi:hypothetical protein
VKKEHMADVYRQGDVILKRISDKVPKDAIGEPYTIKITGETGNVHQIQVFKHKYNNQQYVVPETTLLTHPEHSVLEIPPGVYYAQQARSWQGGIVAD